MLKYIERFLLRGYEEVAVPRELDSRKSIIEGMVGKRVRIFDSGHDKPLSGKVGRLSNPNEYILKKWGVGEILFSENLYGLCVKTEKYNFCER